MTIPGLTLAILENEKEFDSIQEDVLFELKKFGKVISFTFPRLKDLR